METPLPHHKYFASQKEDEEVLLIVRRHWIVYLPAFGIAAIIMASCFIFYGSLESIELIRNSYLIHVLSVSFISILVLFMILFVYISWLVNYLNFQLITNQHLVDIEQMMLFSRKISELTLEDIQDVSATQKGALQSIFLYGEVVVQTAGEKPNFVLEKVKDPYEVSRQIMEIKDQYTEKGLGEGIKESSV